MRKYIRIIVSFVLLLTDSIFVGNIVSASERYAPMSVLSTGEWVKIKIANTGLYQLSYKQLHDFGFSDPSRVAVFGYGGAMLPEDFSKPYIDDLPQVPVLHTAEKLIFYAQGVVSWTLKNDAFMRTRNPYSMYGYYFLTQLDTLPLSPQSVPSTSSHSSRAVNTFHDYLLHEVEKVSPGRMGRNFYGENFLFNAVQNFVFDVSGISETPIAVQMRFIAKSMSASTVSLAINNEVKGKNTITPIIDSDGQKYKSGVETEIKASFVRRHDDADEMKITFTGSGATAAYLDYILLNMERKLQLYDGMVAFRHKSAVSQRLQYDVEVGDASTLHVWDVSLPHSPSKIDATIDAGIMSFTSTEIGLKEYVAFDETATFATPEYVGNVVNQNLHALPQADFIIVAPQAFTSDAKRLGEFHLAHDSLSYHVVTPGVIYNEFSSGVPDATAIRRFMKMFYDRSSSDKSTRPRYLLLFGDGSYDNRRVTEEWASYDYPFLLTFQSDESVDEKQNYVTDDYFGFLEDNEGADISRARMSVGVGRFPVRTKSEAKAAVDKVIAYATNTDYGTWKNDICLVADDGNSGVHMEQSDALAQILESKNPEFFVHKLYIDAYNRVSAATGATYPDAKNQMLNLLKRDGLLVINYVGHGSTKGWTAEKILEWSDISNMFVSRLPLWITATCDFSRFDDRPTSGGESLFLNENGGGVALISTTRVVFIHANGLINEAIVQHLFDRDTDGNVVRLGDVMRLGKNNVNSTASDVLMNKLNYILLGDPALRLSVPDYKMAVTAINEADIADTEPEDIVLQARSWVTVKGEVQTQSGVRMNDFNGLIYPRLYDSQQEVVTAGNGNDNGVVEPYTFTRRDNLLYTGRDSVRSGEFAFTFKMPRELNYSDAPGLFNLYAYDSKGFEAQGVNSHFVVGGMDNDVESDSEGPQIVSAYMNTSSFEDGDKVNETPMFIARVEDPSGINISGIGLGHDMTVCIDNDPRKEYVVNKYFMPVIGQFGIGDVYYQLPTLSEGKHSLSFMVWDTEGNSSETTLRFTVKRGLKPHIYDMYHASEQEKARFFLRHDRPGMRMTMRLSVYDWSGREVWSTETTDMSETFTATPIEWPYTDNSGRRVPAGMYLYRAIISVNGGAETTKTRKILVLPQ